MAASSTGRTIVVAVDFGTTFSGIAWAQTSNSTTESYDGMTSEKVPSEVSYEYTKSGPKCLWGFQILDNMPRHQWIKLGLAPDQKLGLGTRISSSYGDCRRISLPYHSTPADVVTDYLRSLQEHLSVILKSKIGTSLDSTSLSFGGASKIRIISEPEAAAIHSLSASSPHGLEVGDTIVLCDAGGGTVDLITYSIIELVPNMRLKEEAPGAGALCGSTSLNRRFEELLNNRLSSLPEWDRDTLDEAMQRFENVGKRTFSGNVQDDFIVPVPGIADDETIGVRRGRLRVTGRDMQQLFLPVLQEVKGLVSDQITTSDGKVTAIFLVGSFGQSPYLRKYLRDAFSPDIQVMAHVDGWTAVVRGALAKTLGAISPLAVQSFWSEIYGHYRISVMHWFICKVEHDCRFGNKLWFSMARLIPYETFSMRMRLLVNSLLCILTAVSDEYPFAL
ncbi:hypothetical protein BO70DRAFT_398947 [Aspergillus heteromorphus CBS 117.55]|uniref:Actin-like ATPase domain-containing protein n=1 Tax=Aspergillus heteromorphus CBS 117.55 TaxID=1448321 RepID=A0A317VJU7_9EURO|nr:uncharacterized protein BO70DRAFT_398947 [Aspergillus heteromorphus CBS 117.55]PWY73729.1 hypothetical protein BO70DRAFT_398947 [Aspergillus heteromorphus CBS 117.55]